MKRTGIRRLAVPSTVSLGVALVYFACVLLICRSALQSRSLGVGDAPAPTMDSGDMSYPWKHDAATAVSSIVDAQEPAVYESFNVTLSRLDGWPTWFPEDLYAYRDEVLNDTWATETARHRAEIAPWTWHHHGAAPFLGSQRAAFVVLIRNRELADFLATMRQLEDRFNRRYHYPYVFLNDQPFTDEFMHTVAASTDSNVTFAMIPREHWSVPQFVDRKEARQARERMGKSGVIYGHSLSYRHMCRYNSGFFFRHPLLLDLDWYWRVEPGVDFYCDIDYDPFEFMARGGKKYSFVVALRELAKTIPTLWDHTLQYMIERNVTSNWMSYFVGRQGEYNLCHFWSNFEIASLAWLRSPAYLDYFDYLDRARGFFMERWGDAPVHSLAAGMLLARDEVHFFDDIGYRHDEFARCPQLDSAQMQLRCRCPRDMENFDSSPGSCLPRWKQLEEGVWTAQDSREALRLVSRGRLEASGLEPPIAAERRRWYNFFGAF